MKQIVEIACVVLLVGCSGARKDVSTLINFTHLEHLTQRIVFEGDTVAIVHIYSEYPDYKWMDAKESGPEGIACVDDAARATVVYLRHYELTGDPKSAERARFLLRFVMKMQADDGQFYNFIFADHCINRDGKTSYKSFGWWAARAVWALSQGYRIFQTSDARFAEKLKYAVEKTFPHIEAILSRHGKYAEIRGFRVPQWLIYQYEEYSAAATSELLIGLCEFYRAASQPTVKSYIEKFAEAFLALQAGDFDRPPYGAFLSEAGLWHDWANGQTQALAMAAKLLKRPDWLSAAEREVRWFYSRLLIDGHYREWNLTNDTRRQFTQIAYGFRPMIVGSLRLAEATSKPEYETMAGLLASWFFGNNAAGKPMYDPQTGRCYDGLEDSTKINLNSGAESTIEALYSILEVEQSKRGGQFMKAQVVERGTVGKNRYVVFRNEQGEELTLVLDAGKKDLGIVEGRGILSSD
jgi:hypothetical protein